MAMIASWRQGRAPGRDVDEDVGWEAIAVRNVRRPSERGEKAD